MNGRQFMKRGHSGTRIRVLSKGVRVRVRVRVPWFRTYSIRFGWGFQEVRVCAKVSLLLVTCQFFLLLFKLRSSESFFICHLNLCRPFLKKCTGYLCMHNR